MGLDDVIRSMLVDVGEISKRAEFRIDQPTSVFPKEYELGEKGFYGYYRRGDTSVHTGNFIPIWLYSLIPYTIKTIIYIRPDKTKDDFYNYCGVNPEQLADLITEDKAVVPILANDPAAYKEDVFGEFFRKLKEKKIELIRGQLYEDCVSEIKFGMRFSDRTEELEKEYREICKKYKKNQITVYNDEKKKNPLIPDLEKLPHFTAERVAWQKLEGNEENIKEIEKALRIDPLYAYNRVRLIHYTVVPKYYSRGGITWLAKEEDEKIEYENIRVGLNNASEETVKIQFLYPKSVRETPKGPLKFIHKLLNTYSKDDFLKDEKLGNLIETRRFYESPKEQYAENTEKIREASYPWNNAISDIVKGEETREVVKIRFLQGVFNAPSIPNLINFVNNPISATPDFLQILFYLLDIGKSREEARERINKNLNELRGIVNLKINTPYSVVSVNNPI